MLDRLGRQNLDEIEATVARHGIDCDFERTGELAVATRPWHLPDLWDHAAAARRLAAASGRAAARPNCWTRRACGPRSPRRRYYGGLWDRDGCALVDPARLAWGLRRACLDAGVRIYEQTPVGAIHPEGPGLRLSAPHGSVRAPRAALGTGAYPPLLRRLRRYLVPVYDYAMMTEPLSAAQRASIGWRHRQGVGDMGNQFHYYRLTGDGRILWGGYDAVYYNGGLITAGQDQRPATFAQLAGQFFETFPQLEGLRFTHTWGGVIDTCARFCVFFGTAHRGRLAYAAGYTGLGRRRLPVRRQRAARPAQRAADRADRAGHGARQAGAVPARAAALRGKLDAAGVRAEVASPAYYGGLWDRDGCALVDPARLAWGLRRACLDAGVRIYEQTPVGAIHPEGPGLRLSTPHGSVRAPRAALGTGAYPPLLRRLRLYLVPVYDYAMMTEPLSADQRAGLGWRNRQGLADMGNQFHYYRLTGDGRILWGGYDAVYYNGGLITAGQDQRPVTFARLAEQFFETFPQLEGLRFTHTWGGVIDTCARFCVFFGTAHRGRLAYAAGYTGLGVGASRFGGNVLLDLLSGQPTERTALGLVAGKPVPFPPEPLRPP